MDSGSYISDDMPRPHSYPNLSVQPAKNGYAWEMKLTFCASATFWKARTSQSVSYGQVAGLQPISCWGMACLQVFSSSSFLEVPEACRMTWTHTPSLARGKEGKEGSRKDQASLCTSDWHLCSQHIRKTLPVCNPLSSTALAHENQATQYTKFHVMFSSGTKDSWTEQKTVGSWNVKQRMFRW